MGIWGVADSQSKVLAQQTLRPESEPKNQPKKLCVVAYALRFIIPVLGRRVSGTCWPSRLFNWQTPDPYDERS